MRRVFRAGSDVIVKSSKELTLKSETASSVRVCGQKNMSDDRRHTPLAQIDIRRVLTLAMPGKAPEWGCGIGVTGLICPVWISEQGV